MKDDSFKDFVLDQLREFGAVECRAMFGGHGLYRDAVFFGIIWKGRLYFRTNPEGRQKFIERGMAPFQPDLKNTRAKKASRGPRILTSYYEVPTEVFEDTRQIAEWAARAVASRA